MGRWIRWRNGSCCKSLSVVCLSFTILNTFKNEKGGIDILVSYSSVNDIFIRSMWSCLQQLQLAAKSDLQKVLYAFWSDYYRFPKNMVFAAYFLGVAQIEWSSLLVLIQSCNRHAIRANVNKPSKHSFLPTTSKRLLYHDACSVRDAIVFPLFSVFVRTGENVSNRLPVDAYFFENKGKNLRFQTKTDTCGRGLSLIQSFYVQTAWQYNSQ